MSEKKPIRILQIVTAMNRGGAETMIMNYYRALDKSRYQFDFLVHRSERADYDDEIESMGGRIYHAIPIRPWSYLRYFRWLNSFFSHNAENYVAVHGHIQENSGFALYFAKKNGIKNLIASSHIADLGIDYKYLFRLFGKIWTNEFAQVKLACGDAAGRFLYGKREFKILKNAIPYTDYLFNPSVRMSVRKELGVGPETIIVGNVARFCPQKNHLFLIRIFAALVESHPDSVLVLVGEGPLFEKAKALSEGLKVSDKIRFMGLRGDVNQLLQAFDVYVMPSLFEGLPVSVIEAQAAGLQCVISDTVDPQTDITGNVSYISLKAPLSEWVDKLIYCARQPRKDMSTELIEAGYDVGHNLKKLLDIYGVNV